MNTHDADAVVAGLESALRRSQEHERLRLDRDSFARLCAQAVNDGDMAAAVDWADEYALTVGAIGVLIDSQDATGGDGS